MPRTAILTAVTLAALGGLALGHTLRPACAPCPRPPVPYTQNAAVDYYFAAPVLWDDLEAEAYHTEGEL
jgi:hypothetical protein